MIGGRAGGRGPVRHYNCEQEGHVGNFHFLECPGVPSARLTRMQQKIVLSSLKDGRTDLDRGEQI